MLALVNELIDTLWNVNNVTFNRRYTSSRINRYIMECKYGKRGKGKKYYYELIDTLWNVN